MRNSERFAVRCLAGMALAVGAAIPSNAAVIFNFDASSPIQSFLAAVGIVSPNLTYNPSTQGAITSLNFSIDTASSWNFAPDMPVGSQSNARAVIYQNGNYYAALATGIFPGPGIFTTDSGSGWTATNFGLFDLTTGNINMASNPNFSSSGGQIEFGTGGVFGFTCRFGNADLLSCPFQLQYSVVRQNMSYTINDPIGISDINFSDIANYNITDFLISSDPVGAINTSVGFVAVPEPASLPVTLVGLLALVGFTRFAPRGVRSGAPRAQ